MNGHINADKYRYYSYQNLISAAKIMITLYASEGDADVFVTRYLKDSSEKVNPFHLISYISYISCTLIKLMCALKDYLSIGARCK